MSFCGHCGQKMKPLLTGEFCPNDCDRKNKAPDPFDGIFEKPEGSPTYDAWQEAVEEWYNTVYDKTQPIDNSEVEATD